MFATRSVQLAHSGTRDPASDLAVVTVGARTYLQSSQKMKLIQEELERTNRTIDLIDGYIGRQLALIDKMTQTGGETSNARSMLATYRRNRQIFVAHRDRLERELESNRRRYKAT